MLNQGREETSLRLFSCLSLKAGCKIEKEKNGFKSQFILDSLDIIHVCEHTLLMTLIDTTIVRMVIRMKQLFFKAVQVMSRVKKNLKKITLRCLVGQKSSQFPVLRLLWQQWNGEIGPHPHCIVLTLLLSSNFLFHLKHKIHQSCQ